MASKTQIRLTQLTGSLDDSGAKVLPSAITDKSLQGVLDALAASVKRIHGGAIYSNQDPGTFETDLVVKGVTPTITIGDAGTEDTALVFDGSAQDFYLGLDDTDSKLKLGLGAAVGTTPNMELASATRDVEFKGKVIVPDAGNIGSATDPDAIAISSAGVISLSAVTEATAIGAAALVVAGGASVAKDLYVGLDLNVKSNAAAVTIGDAEPFTLTHSNASNTLLASANHRLAFGTADDYIVGDGTDLDIISSGDLDITATLVDVTGGLTVSGLTTASGRVIVDDITDAATTTDGSLQTDGGLSVVKDVIIGNDAYLLNDAAVLGLGAGKDVTLTHDGGTGATLASAGAFVLDGANAVSIDGVSGVNLGINDNAAPISIGHTTSETTVNDNLTVTGDLTVNGATVTISDNLVVSGDLTVNGTQTAINSVQLNVEDKQMRLGIPGGMTVSGDATYSLTTNVATVTNSAHGLTIGQFVYISDPAATPLIPEGVYEIASVPTLATFTFAYTRANVAALTAINHSIDDVTAATADGSGIFVSVGSTVPTGIEWDTTNGWQILGGDLDISASKNLSFAGTSILADSGGTMTLSNVDAIDTTTEATIEAAIDTLPNLTSAAALVTVSTLGTGAISAGFGNIDNGASTLDTGVGTLASLVCTAGATFGGGLGATGVTISTLGAISADARIVTDDATEATTTTDGSLQTDGGLSVAKSAVVGIDLDMLKDGGIVNFGADKDVNLTHVHNAGLLLNGAMSLQFGDANTRISQAADGVLHHVADVQHLFDGGGSLNMHLTGSSRMGIATNSATAFSIQDKANNLFAISTTAGSEAVRSFALFQADADIKMSNSSAAITVSNSQAAALSFKNVAGASFLVVDTANNGVGTPDNIGLTAGNTGDLNLSHNGTNSQIVNATGILEMRSSGGNLVLSASAANSEIQFGDAYCGPLLANGLLQLADSAGEWSAYVANFATTTSLVGALNSLASGGTRGKFQVAVTGSHVANIPLLISTALDHDAGSGGPAALDVYVNGQLLTSGTAISDGDYKIGIADIDRVQFFFGLEDGDQVTVMKP